MDPKCYKQFTSDRGLTYNYYLSCGSNQKITLLFCHGFPSTSTDWQKQVLFFEKEGFACVVPDMLGYGGSDKPTDPSNYGMKELAAEMIQLITNEKLQNVVAIGHDWYFVFFFFIFAKTLTAFDRGSFLVSRIANEQEGKDGSPFVGYAFLSASYMPPNPTFDYDTVMAFYEKTFGYGLIGYWKFFSWDGGAEQILKDHASASSSCD